MYQSAIFNKQQYDASIIEENQFGYRDLFDAKSLLKGDVFSCIVGNGDKADLRTVEKAAVCDVYRNLNKSNFYSIKNCNGQFKNKVSGYAHAVIIRHPKLIVSKAGRARVRRDSRKNVHSYVRGEFCDAFNADAMLSRLTTYLRLSYSPYLFDSFYMLDRDKNGNIVDGSIVPFEGQIAYEYALVNGKDVFLFDL